MQPIPIQIYTASWFLMIIRPILRTILVLIYFWKKKTVPPITDPTLKQSALQLARNIRSKKQTSVDIVKCYINRIKKVQPYINAVVDDRFTEALEDARKADDFISNSGKTAKQLAEEFPFLGVPFTCKESLAVKGLSYASGSLYRKGIIAEEDAEAVHLLRKAGAIPLAVTLVPEICLWFESHNLLHGRCNNPYDTRRTPGGSSGGEGALLASGGSIIGVGSDFRGSIRLPAHFCGLFAHKCSTGLISTRGQHPVPVNESMKPFLSIGVMSRYACDIMPLFKVIVSSDKVNDLNLEDKVDVKQLKFYYIGITDHKRFSAHSIQNEILEAIQKVQRYLKEYLDIELQQLNLPGMNYITPMVLANLRGPIFEIPSMLTDGNGEVNPRVEIMKKFFGISKHTVHGINLAMAADSNFQYDSFGHKHYLRESRKLRNDLEAILGLDGVLIFPSYPTAAQYHNENLPAPLDCVYFAIFNVFGFPSTQFPTGLNKKGLPIGLQVVAARNQDRLTIAVAEEMENAFGGWVPPF